MELLLSLLLLTFFLIMWYRTKSTDDPPGPPRVPLLGCLPFLTLKRGVVDWVLDKCVLQHKICTVEVFNTTKIFVVNDFDLCKEIFAKEEFSGRPVNKVALLHRFYQKKAQGIIFTENKKWSVQRRFSLKTLKDFGFGKQSLEEAMNLEIECLIEQLKQHEEDYQMTTDFNIPIINILWQLAASTRFTEEDYEGIELVEKVNYLFSKGLRNAVLPMWVNKMFPNITGYRERINVFDAQKDYIMNIIEEHKKILDIHNPRDFIDVYLIEMENQESSEVEFSEEELGSILLDFFHAGTETSSTTLKWIILYLCLHQDVQDK